MKNKYDLRGVSAGKEDVHAAIRHLDKGLYPSAFCKVLPDFAGGNDRYCNIMHADTAGTKTSLAYLYWRETGDLSVWEGIVQDALVMNLDDMACVGCTQDIILSSTIGRNKHLIPGEVVRTLIQAAARFVERMEEFGIRLHLSGGETADVGDIVRTVDVGFTTFARMKRSDLVINDIKAGDVVVGLAGFGQATYEDAYNSGMGSNGLTGARHDVLSHHYAAHYPESYDPNTPASVVYTGDKRLTDPVALPDGQEATVGKLLLSPTRTYLPLLQKILEEFTGKRRSALHGIIHCTGGGQTKVLHFLQGKRVVKHNLFPPPPLFSLVRESSRTSWREMYQVFNMGHRLEVYLPEEEAQAIIAIARFFNIEARIVGYVEDAAESSVLIHGPEGVLEYR